jgi:hypothetical protein
LRLILDATFCIIFELAQLRNKLYSGILFGVMIQFGIVGGTALAYPFNYLVKKF